MKNLRLAVKIGILVAVLLPTVMPPRVAGDTANHGVDARPALVVGVCTLHNELMMIIDPAWLVEATEKAIG